MKTTLSLSTLALSAVLGAATIHADEAVVNEGEAVESGAVDTTKVKSVAESAVNVVKKSAAKVGETLKLGESEIGKTEGDDVPALPEKAVEKKAAEKAVVEKPVMENAPTTGDTKDAEADRKVSDTSIAIFSQNPYIQSVMEDTTHIKAARLKELMARGDEVTMLDIRPRSEFAKTPGIAGVTLNIPRNFLEVEAYEKLPDRDASIIIISTKGIRGGLAANTLQQMGYTNVRNLMDGLEGWNKAK